MSIAHIVQFTIHEFHFQLSVSLIRCVCQTATFHYLMLINVLFSEHHPCACSECHPYGHE